MIVDKARIFIKAGNGGNGADQTAVTAEMAAILSL